MLANASLKISNGDTDYVTVTDGFGDLIITDTGLVGAIGGSFAVTIPGVALSGDLNILVNTTGEAFTEQFVVAADGSTRDGIEAGNFFQLVGENLSLQIADQELSGNIFLRNETLADGSTITLLGLSDISASFGDGTTTFLSLSNGSGILRVTPDGVAGQFSVSVATDPSLAFSLNVDELQIAVNTTTVAVRETITLAGQDLILDLPAGPYFRISAIGAELVIADQALTADVSFQQSTVNGQTEIRVVITRASLQLGPANDPFLTLSNGRGVLLIKSFTDASTGAASSGLVGTISGSVALNIPGVTFTGDLGLEINQTPVAVNEIFELGDETIAVSLPAGPFFKVSANNAELEIAGQTLSGNFAFTQTADVTSIEVRDAELNLGDGLLVVTIESGKLDLFADGVVAEMTGGIRFGIDDIELSVASVGLQINTRTSAPAQFVRVVAEDVVVSIPGIDINGDVAFEQVTVGTRNVVRLAITDLNAQIGEGPNPLVDIKDSSAQLLILPEGIAGQIIVGADPFNIPGLDFTVDQVTVQINTLPFAVTTEMTAFAGNAGFALPKGPFIRVEAINASIAPTGLSVGGSDVSLSGNFLFEQRGEGLAAVTTLAASNVSATIEFNGEGAQFVDGEGVFVLTNGGLAGLLSGRADISLGPVGAGGDLALRINNTGAAVNETVILNGAELPISFGPNEGNVFDISISDLTINIGDFVSISGNVAFSDGTIDINGVDVAAKTFAGEDLEIFLGQGPLRIGDEQLNPLAKGALLSNAQVGLIQLSNGGPNAPPTYALVATGTISLIGVDGVTISAEATVRVNTTGEEIDETLTIAGSTGDGVRVNFDDGAETKEFIAINATLDVLGQSIGGDFSFSQAATAGPDGIFGNVDDGSTLQIAAANVNINLGTDSAGVSIINGSGALIVTEAGVAGTISAGIELNVPGVVVQNTNFTVSINTTPTAINEDFMIGSSTVNLDVPAGQFFRIEGSAELIILDQRLSGNFAIESTTDATTGASLITIFASEVNLALTSGGEDIVAISNGSGALVISEAGLAGRIEGSVSINIPDVTLDGDFSLLINNTNVVVNQDFTFAGQTYNLSLPTGPYFRFEAVNVSINLFDQVIINADVAFEQVQSLGADGLPGGTGADFDAQIVRISFNNVSVNLADGLLTLDNGTGLFVVTDAGLAGRIGGDIALGVEGITLEGNLQLEVNNTGADVDETLRVGSATLGLQISAGQTFRIAGDDITLVVGGLRLKTDVAITETPLAGGEKALSVEVTDFSFGLGGTEENPIIGVNVASAQFLFLPTGIAAKVTGLEPILNVDGVTLEGLVDFELNTTTTTQLGITANTVRLNVTGAVIEVLGQRLAGDFAFEQVTTADGQSIVKVAAANVNILLGTEDAGLRLTNGSGLFLITGAGFAAEISATVEILPADAFRLEGRLTLQINTSALSVNEDFTVGAATRTLELPAGPYVRFEGADVVLAVAGQRLSGDFVFEQIVLDRGADLNVTTDDTTAIRIAARNVELGLGDGDRDFVTLSNGEGYFVLISGPNPAGNGLAGRLTVDVATDLPGFEFSGTLTLEINQTGVAVNQTFVVDNIAEELELEAGIYIKASGTNLSIEIAGQILRGNFSFEQRDEAGEQVTILGFDEVELGLGDGTTDFVRVTQGSGELIMRSTGVSGSFTGVIALNVPDVTMGGTATVVFDTATGDFSITVENVLINVLSQQLTADAVVIEQFTIPETGETIVRLLITNFRLALNDGTDDIIVVTAASTALVVNAQGMGLRVSNAGISASLGDSLSLDVTEANFLLNTSGSEVDLGDGLPALAAGPYVRVEVVSGALNVGPVAITGGFLFDQTTDGVTGDVTTRIAIDNAALSVNGEDVAAADGAVVLFADGIAGNLTGRLDVGGGDVSVGAAVTVSINTTGRQINESIMLGEREFVIDLAPIAENGGIRVEVSAEIRIGDFILVEIDNGSITGGSGTVFVGQGPAFVGDDPATRTVNPAAKGFLLTDARFARSADSETFVAEGVVQVIGLEGFALSGRIRVVFASTAGSGRVLELSSTTSGLPAEDVNMPDTPATIITVDDLDLNIAGQTISGDFRFTIGQDLIEIGVSDLRAAFGGTSRNAQNELVTEEYVILTSPASTFRYTPAGFAGVIDGTLQFNLPTPDVDFGDGVSAKLEINTTPTSQTLDVGGTDVTLPAGQFLRITASLDVTIFGQELSGTFSFEQTEGELTQEARDRGVVPPQFVKIGIIDLNIFLGDRGGAGDADDAGLEITNGKGAFIISDAGFAGQAGGTVALMIPGVDVSFRGDFQLLINTGAEEVQEVVQIGDASINVNIPAGPFLQVAATNLELDLLGQTLRGNFVFQQATENNQQILRIAASDVFIGIGDGTQNLVSINQGSAAIRIDQNGIAGAISGNFTESIPGIDISANMSLLFNTGTVEVTETIEIPGADDVTLTVPAAAVGAPFIRFRAEDIEVVIAGQELRGTFQFEQGVRADGEKYLSFLVEDASLSLGDGFADLTDINGAFLVTRGAVAGQLSLGASLNLGPVSISADTIVIRVNTGTGPVILDDVVQTRIEAGPFFEIAALGGMIDAAGVVLEADFFVRKETTINGQSRLTLAIRDLSIDFAGVAITQGNGTLLILPDAIDTDGNPLPNTGGMAGQLSATVDASGLVDGVELSGTFSLQINTTAGRVNESIPIPGSDDPILIDLPAGPYFRIGVDQAVLSIAGQSISGSFAIENVTTPTGTLLSIAALDVAISLGDGQKEYVSLTRGTGTLLIIENTVNNVTTKGLAGRISGTVELKNIPGVSLSSDLVLEINNTNTAINTSVEVGGVDLPLVLDSGDYIRFTAANTTLTVAGQTLGGNFFFERSIIPGIGNAPPSTVIRLGGSDINFFLGGDMGTTDVFTDDAGLRMTGGTLALVISPDGVAGVIGGSVSLRIPNLVETSATVTVTINNTGKALMSTFPIPNADGSGDLMLNLESGVYFRVTIEDFSLDLFGQTLSGDFSFEQITSPGADGQFNTTDDEKTLKLAIANLSLFLGDNGGTAGFENDSDDIGLWITGGTASLIVSPRGLAGEFSATAAVYITRGEGIGVERVTVRINNTNAAVNETFRIGDIEQTLTLPAGPYISVKVEGLEIDLGGQIIRGDFTFIRQTDLGNDNMVGGTGANADVSTTRIMLENVLISLSANGQEFVRAESPVDTPSTLEIISGPNGGIVGLITVQVTVSIPGVSVGGLFSVGFNSLTRPGATPSAARVPISYDLDVDGIPSTPAVTVAAGITVTGVGVYLDVLGQRLTGNFSFQKSATGEIVIAITDTVLELGNGDETFITASIANGVIIVNAQGIAADLQVGLVLSPSLSQDIQFTADNNIFLKINTTNAAVNRM
ncbi:hypothetical protein N9Y81_01985, partial [Akkermansiaceae bacterium]|nr:hypothetical protein [Akkermansiaceae bacterium]